jgi:hypothetical protein
LEQVVLNGAVLVRGHDYTATTGTTITGLSPALVASDVLEVFSFIAFTVANTYTQSQVDGFLGGSNTAWTSYTPTWTNLTVGNGTNNFAYKQIGKTVFVRGSFVFGSTSSISGGVSFTLPVNSIAYAESHSFGVCEFEDSGTADLGGVLYYTSTNKCSIRALKVDVTYAQWAGLSSTVPFTWTTNDGIRFHFIYEAA